MFCAYALFRVFLLSFFPLHFLLFFKSLVHLAKNQVKDIIFYKAAELDSLEEEKFFKMLKTRAKA